jgi:predicted aconitase with swiveling domain
LDALPIRNGGFVEVPDSAAPPLACRKLNATVAVEGAASGPVRAASDIISFWGGYDPSTGIVIDRRHSLSGRCLTGTIFVLPHGKGSSTGSVVLLRRPRPGERTGPVQQGWVQTIEAFGARFSTDICLCMLNPDMLAPDTRTVMTNSGKFAHYGPGLIQRGIWFGALGDCVESAVTGTPHITTPVWAAAS